MSAAGAAQNHRGTPSLMTLREATVTVTVVWVDPPPESFAQTSTAYVPSRGNAWPGSGEPLRFPSPNP